MAGRAVAAAAVAVVAAAILLLAGPASAHSLASSTVTVELSEQGMTGSVSVAVASLDEAFDPGRRSDALSAEAYAAQVVSYLDDHLTVTGPDGALWPERYSQPVRRTVEGIETITIDMTVDVAGDDPRAFSIAYDAIIEAVPGHSAVLVLVDAGNRASTPGVFTSAGSTITIGPGPPATGAADMVRYGFHHVLDGADHLLFLIALLLPAPLVAAGGRWGPGRGLRSSLGRLAHVVTAFTAGHSLTLVATALGWIAVPSRPVEMLIAVSVAVSAVHAMRPLTPRAEPVIAATFGLVHGLAFAGILADLGLDGSRSLSALLAFNVGIELAQLAVASCVFPSLFLMSTGSCYRTVRIVGASIAVAAAAAWLIDRSGLGANPLLATEESLIRHPLAVAAGLAAVAVAVRVLGSPRGDRVPSGERAQAANPPAVPV